MAGRNVYTALKETAARFGTEAALHQPLGAKSGGGYRTYSWEQWSTAAQEIAVGLREIGVKLGDIVCILCETRAEFYIVDIGVMAAGAASGALYTAYPIPDLAKNVRSIAPNVLFVEDSSTWTALSAAMDEIGAPRPAHVIIISGEHAGCMSLEELQQLGRIRLESDPGVFDRIQDEITPDDPAILYLTSGATGEPKMSLTSHAAVLANADMGPAVLNSGIKDCMLVFLPSAHIAQRIVCEMVPLRSGTPVWFSESLGKLPSELKAIRPTIFLAPPRVWERMYSSIQTELRKRPERARKIFERALTIGQKVATLKARARKVPLWLSAPNALAHRIVFSKIRERLGGRIRIAASGAAPLGAQLAEFYSAIGLPLIEGYGLTEAGVVSLNPLNNPRPGSIGKALPGVEMRLADDGELQLRTPCLFTGYYKDEAATRSVMTADGWFCTGDIAEQDKNGFWYITGRKKELIVSSNGKKIYPARIETLFRLEPAISQILIIGDKQPYVTALITINETHRQAAADTASKTVREAVTRVNRQLADFEQIRRFKVLETDFSIERGELTPTMKIRRAKVLENYSETIAELYLGRQEMQ